MRIQKCRSYVAIAVLLLCFILPFSAYAHSGRTDGSGGHKDNKNASGLGSYHYHCGGNPAHLHTNGVCPYKSGGSGGSSGSGSNTPTPKPVVVSRIMIEDVPAELNIGDTHTAKGSVYPDNAENKDITWKSSDESIAIVSSSGVIKGVGAGNVTITAVTSNNVSSSFSVAIREVIASDIVITNIPKTVAVGDTATLKVTLSPNNTSSKDITWRSSRPEIAAIDASGKLIALAAGETTITATQKDVDTSFELTVKPAEVDSILISTSENRVRKGETLSLSIQIMPEYAADKSIKWETSDRAIATIEEGILTAHDVGKITVTATAANGKTNSLEIEVYSNTTSVVAGSVLGAAAIGGGLFAVIRKRKRIV
jgi:uncharacterized protein YjdB